LYAQLFTENCARISDFDELTALISDALADELPAVISDGGVIRAGYSPELDELRAASSEGKKWLSSIQQREIERTGIKSLKVKFNSVFGYYIEVSKSNLAAVPDDYIRKQTLVNAERFITPELKELESRILGAEEKALALEQKLFEALRTRATARTADIQQSADALAEIDAIAGFAEAARLHGYSRPAIFDDDRLDIQGGRHPVLDDFMGYGKFVPNDTLLDGDSNRMMVITGPNMAGKSTYIRQTALLVIMAQAGSFVPAEKMEIGLADRIFTRIGASDDLARGQSTFMVEMVETANILRHATDRSLVILDEVGRGTSTFDGLSLAWSIAEYLHDQSRSRTMFATHYHELTALAQTRKGVNNYNVAVREYGDEVIFLRQIVPGAADRSYGIHVARLAGVPDPVLERAKSILELLENNAASPRDAIAALPRKPVRNRRRNNVPDDMPDDDIIQLSLL
jgi:DNA mismatch repair protein MutS